MNNGFVRFCDGFTVAVSQRLDVANMTIPQAFNTSRMLRVKEVCAHLSISRSSLYSRMQKGSKQYDPQCPRPINISATGKGSVRWLEAEINAYIEYLIVKSRSN